MLVVFFALLKVGLELCCVVAGEWIGGNDGSCCVVGWLFGWRVTLW